MVVLVLCMMTTVFVEFHAMGNFRYIFFHDLWDTNNEVGKISKQQEAFDPS